MYGFSDKQSDYRCNITIFITDILSTAKVKIFSQSYAVIVSFISSDTKGCSCQGEFKSIRRRGRSSLVTASCSNNITVMKLFLLLYCIY